MYSKACLGASSTVETIRAIITPTVVPAGPSHESFKGVRETELARLW